MISDNCRRCEHTRKDHPNDFLCMVDDCRCPGFFAVKHPNRKDLQ